MSEVRCHCGFGRLDECERFGHEQGSRLDHERALRNLDRAQKRLRKFKRAMINFFPHIDPAETDIAVRAIYEENRDLRNRLFALESNTRPVSNNNDVISLPSSVVPTPILCEACGGFATRSDDEGVPLCGSCYSELSEAQPASERD